MVEVDLFRWNANMVHVYFVCQMGGSGQILFSLRYGQAVDRMNAICMVWDLG